MGKGIAVLFKNKFKRVEELKSQGLMQIPKIYTITIVSSLTIGARKGGLAVLTNGPGRFVYYMVTKDRYFDKPTYVSVLAQHTNRDCDLMGLV